jgi:hypothetical protein
MSELLKKLQAMKERSAQAPKTGPTVPTAPVVEKLREVTPIRPEPAINPPVDVGSLEEVLKREGVAGISIIEDVGDSAPNPTTVDVPKAKRGRPPGSKNKPKDEVVTAAKEIYAPVIDEIGRLMGDAGRGFILYINCIPINSGASNLDEVLRAAGESAAKAWGVKHYRLIKFGGGPAQLCVELEKILNQMADSGTLPAKVAVDNSSQIAQDALPILNSFAVETVRALR